LAHLSPYGQAKRKSEAKSRMTRFRYLLAIVLGSLAVVWAQQSDRDAESTAAKLVTATRDWSNGIPSTPGTSVEVREVSRTIQQNQPIVRYHVSVKGAPKNKIYALVNWPVSAAGPSVAIDGLTLAPDGLVLCAGRAPNQCTSPSGKDDPVEFAFRPIQGDIYRMGLVSSDGAIRIFFAIIPIPLVGSDRGCTLEAIRLLPKFEIAMLRTKGFKPNEALQLATKSYDEAHDMQVTADEKGEFTMSLLPFVKGNDSGKTDVKLKGASCSPAVSFEWGK